METEDPRPRPPRPEDAGPEDTGAERRSAFRLAAVVAVALFLFLVGYFMVSGPLDPEHEAAYPPAGRNLELENKAKPPPAPDTL